MRKRSSYKDAVLTGKLGEPGSQLTWWPCRPLITKEAWRCLEGPIPNGGRGVELRRALMTWRGASERTGAGHAGLEGWHAGRVCGDQPVCPLACRS